MASTIRDRIAILISIDSYCDDATGGTTRQIPAGFRFSNGQLVSERTIELQQLFEGLGCTVITITNITEDMSDPDAMKKIFQSKTDGLCSPNSLVFVCLLGMVYSFKEGPEGCGVGLLLRNSVAALSNREHCILERHLSVAVLSLPTEYVTIIIEGIYNEHNLKARSIDPWKKMCPLHSRVVVLYTELSPDVVKGNEKWEKDQLGTRSLTQIVSMLLKGLNEGGALSNKGISYQKLFIMISALWDRLHQTIPCIKGDIDRDVLGSTNYPLPYHLMGTVLKPPSNRIYLLTAGLPGEYIKGRPVKLCHVFRPDIVFDGVVEDSSESTATVAIEGDSRVQEWKQTLKGIKQTFLEKEDDHGTFVYVYKTPLSGSGQYCVNVQVNEANKDEMSSFLKESCLIETPITTNSRHDGGKKVTINMTELNDGGFYVTSTNTDNTFHIPSLQQAKSLFMRLAINEHIRQIRSTNNSPNIHCQCYIHPQRGKDLLSNDGLLKKYFSISSSRSHRECGPENAICEFEDEEHFWSPEMNDPGHSSIYWSVRFNRNIYLKEVEVRGSMSSPNSVPYGYNVYCSSILQLQNNRFDTSSLRNQGKERMKIKLQCIRELGEDEILSDCSGPFTFTIEPLVNQSESKRSILAMKLLCLNANGVEKVMMSYHLECRRYSSAGFSFNHPPSEEGRTINLPDPDQWLIIKYPEVVRDDITLFIPPGVTVTHLLLDNMSANSEFAPPNMISLLLQTTLTSLPLIQCSSCSPKIYQLPTIVPCNQIFLRPVPDPSGGNFHNPICLQVQLRGFSDLSGIEVYDKDLLECVVNHSVTHVIYLTILCVEDTGNVNIMFQQKLFPKDQQFKELIRAFVPKDLIRRDPSVVNDEYLIVVSSSQHHLSSLQQAVDSSGMKYNSKLLEPISEITDDDVQEWSVVYRYKVKVKAR